MKATFIQRFCAYLVDVIFIVIISSIIVAFIPTSPKLEEIVEKQNDLILSVTEEMETLDVDNYVKEISDLSYQYDKLTIPASLVSLVVTVLYFIVLQYFYNGQTIGKKLFRIKVVGKDKKLTMNMLWIRSFIINGLAYSILATVLILIFSYVNDGQTYYMLKSIVSVIDSLFIIIAAIMILYRKDKRGLQDLLAKTEVIKEVNNGA